jgi:predicted TPR repeat methyltransferase
MTQDMTAARHFDIALGELANGHPAAAVSALKRALTLDPNLAPAHNHLGLALEDLARLDEAETSFRNALRIDPSYADARRNLGELLQDRGRLEEASDCFESVIRLTGGAVPPGLHMRLGVVRWKLGDSAGALDAFERSVIESPDSAEAHYNLGSAQLESGTFEEAVRSAREALHLRAGFSEALTLCAAGLAATGDAKAGVELLQQLAGPAISVAQRYLMIAIRLMNSRLFDPARECLERVLHEQPTEAMARHLLSALDGSNPDRPVEGYVRQLFDASAASFDRELVSKLGYAIPREMVDALRAAEPAPKQLWDVLDLGCGTGLVGAEIAPYSKILTGVDLAPNMIELARARGIYTDLHCADLAAVLSEAPREHYDVVTAADVFIYVGKLDAVIPAIRRVLRPGGSFAFSAEALEAGATDGYRLGVMGRYAHNAGYLRELASRNRFDIVLLRQTRIRLEHRRPVDGWLTVWRAL